MSDLFGNISASQSNLAFPAALAEKYRPRDLAEFIGLEKPKKICKVIAAQPFELGLIFLGPSGTGKTTMALALAQMIPAEIHHVPSQECNLETLERISRTCAYVPMAGCKYHLILVDEADQMSTAAQMYCLSKLDATAKLPNTIWVFTCNDKTRFHDRFISRNTMVEFSSYGISKDAAELLEKIWGKEAPAAAEKPNFARIVKDSGNNVRESLSRLQTELILAA